MQLTQNSLTWTLERERKRFSGRCWSHHDNKSNTKQLATHFAENLLENGLVWQRGLGQHSAKQKWHLLCARYSLWNHFENLFLEASVAGWNSRYCGGIWKEYLRYYTVCWLESLAWKCFYLHQATSQITGDFPFPKDAFCKLCMSFSGAKKLTNKATLWYVPVSLQNVDKIIEVPPIEVRLYIVHIDHKVTYTNLYRSHPLKN